MTSQLRRKRRTTARGRSTPLRTALKALVLAGWLLSGPAWAQAPRPVPGPPAPAFGLASSVPLLPPGPTALPPAPIPVLPTAPVRTAPLTAPALPKVAPAPPLFAPVPAAPTPAVSASAPPAPVQPLAYQPLPPPRPADTRTLEEPSEFQINLELPGPERLFRLESEAAWQERMRQEARGRQPMDRIVFPDEPVLARTPYEGRHFPPMGEVVEPHYVCYRRLLFEELNAERYGWDLGLLGAPVSALNFFKDVALLPYHVATNPCRWWECSAGYCEPGDPVPYLLYPPELSLSGLTAEAAVLAGLIAAFP
jgi:hypothetical protein